MRAPTTRALACLSLLLVLLSPAYAEEPLSAEGQTHYDDVVRRIQSGEDVDPGTAADRLIEIEKRNARP